MEVSLSLSTLKVQFKSINLCSRSSEVHNYQRILLILPGDDKLARKKHLLADTFHGATYGQHMVDIPQMVFAIHRGRLPPFRSEIVKHMSPVYNLIDEMSQLEDASFSQVIMSFQF
jgi:hypothetical protein